MPKVEEITVPVNFEITEANKKFFKELIREVVIEILSEVFEQPASDESKPSV